MVWASLVRWRLGVEGWKLEVDCSSLGVSLSNGA